MKRNREFELAWQGLRPGEHQFSFDLDDRFIAELEREPEFTHLQAQVRVTLDKKSNFFLCHFDIDGTLRLPCDRCGDDFDLQLWDEFDLVIKLTDAENAERWEDEADVVFIPRSETVIDLRTWIYDYIVLSIPLQRIHPDLPSGESGCNPQAIHLLEEMKRSAGETEDTEGTEDTEDAENTRPFTLKSLESLIKNKNSKDENQHELN